MIERKPGWLDRPLSAPIIHMLFIAAMLAVVFGACLHYERSIVGKIGLAMDDAWIHTAIARNLMEGLGFGIVPHRPLAVSTSPTWTICVAIAYALVREPVIATLAVSLICTLISALLMYITVGRMTGRPLLGVLTALTLIGNPLMLWGLCSGMELPLSVAALMALFAVYYLYDPDSPQRRYVFPIVLAFAAATRPEIFTLVPFAFLDTACSLWKPLGRRKAARFIFTQAAIVLVCLLPYFVFNFWTSGLLFPTTYYAKTQVRGVGLSAGLAARDFGFIIKCITEDSIKQLYEVMQILYRQNLLVFLLIMPGLFAFSRGLATSATLRGKLLPLAICLLPLIMGITSPSSALSNHAGRYYVIFPPMAIILTGLALDLLIRAGRSAVFAAFIAVAILLAPAGTSGRAMKLLAYDVDSTERLYVDMGRWMESNLPKNVKLAVNDIGGLAYFSPRDFIDVMGLASPETWPAIRRGPGKQQDQRSLYEYLKKEQVEYVLLCPLYYPKITKDEKAFQPVRKWSERYDHNRLISPQILYKVNWPEGEAAEEGKNPSGSTLRHTGATTDRRD